MNSEHISAVQYLTDLGFAAAMLAFFAAYQAYRANPHRSVNRFFTWVSISIGLWQLIVMMARITHNYVLWVSLAAPFSGIFAFGLFFLHNAVIMPVATLRERLRGNPWVFVTALSAILGTGLAYVRSEFPAYSPFIIRAVTLISLAGTFVQSFRAQRRVGRYNPYEMRLFIALAVTLFSCFAVLLFLRTPLGSRINSFLVIISYLWTNWLILSSKALEGSSGRSTGIHIICAVTLALLNLLIAVLLTQFANISDFFPAPALLLIATICNYPAFVALNSLVGRLASRFPRAERAKIRDAALDRFKETTTTVGVLESLKSACESFLDDVKIDVTIRPPEGDLAVLYQPDTPVLTPEIALHTLKEPLQSRILELFPKLHIGATIQVRHYAKTVFVTIGARPWANSFERDELDTVISIARLASFTIEKIEAVDAAARASSLASAGRLAANFAHEARNQLAVITEVLDTLRLGNHAQLDPDFIKVAQEQAQALSSGVNFALSVAKLKDPKMAEKLDPCDLDYETSKAISLCRSFLASSKVELAYERHSKDLGSVLLDPTMFQRILFNLIQNSVQALNAAKTASPRITISVLGGETQSRIEVFDNGPGVPESVHDVLFEPYSTSKADGTGLGLAFCRDMLQRWGGSLEYLNNKGVPNAHFLITLRRRAASSGSTPPVAPAAQAVG